MYHEFCDDCPTCRPNIQSATGKSFKGFTQIGVIMEVWDNDTTYEERESYIKVTVNGSTNDSDMKRSNKVMEKFGQALAKWSLKKNMERR